LVAAAFALAVAGALVLGACGSGAPATSRLYFPAPARTQSVSSVETEASSREAVVRCKRAVAGASLLPAAARSEIERACAKVLGLSGSTAQELRRTICREVANSSLGSESARERERSACEVEAR
jgi:hypothetical protein